MCWYSIQAPRAERSGGNLVVAPLEGKYMVVAFAGVSMVSFTGLKAVMVCGTLVTRS